MSAGVCEGLQVSGSVCRCLGVSAGVCKGLQMPLDACRFDTGEAVGIFCLVERNLGQC